MPKYYFQNILEFFLENLYKKKRKLSRYAVTSYWTEQHVKPLAHLTCHRICDLVSAVDSDSVLNVIQSDNTRCAFDSFKHNLLKTKTRRQQRHSSVYL